MSHCMLDECRVCLAQTAAQGSQHANAEFRKRQQQAIQFFLVQGECFRVFQYMSGGRPRQVIENAHFPETLAIAQFDGKPPVRGIVMQGEADPTRNDDVHLTSGFTLVENPFSRKPCRGFKNQRDAAQLIRTQQFEEGDALQQQNVFNDHLQFGFLELCPRMPARKHTA